MSEVKRVGLLKIIADDTLIWRFEASESVLTVGERLFIVKCVRFVSFHLNRINIRKSCMTVAICYQTIIKDTLTLPHS